ncbi:MAG TPA: antibiotic biosynthesis monooxygenase [Ktedonobacterales bacterium]|nr:antibiotic biosynthesis monooxygenase [Ktedonobacterales bacterium]
MAAYGCYTKFTTQAGQRDALVSLLLSGAAGDETLAGCQLYVINMSPSEPEAVWVTEVWRSQADHDVSLTLASVRALIQQALPLLAGAPERIDVQPVGGFGLAQAPD